MRSLVQSGGGGQRVVHFLTDSTARNIFFMENLILERVLTNILTYLIEYISILKVKPS